MSKHFCPKHGQKDFSFSREAPVVNCVVRYKDRILIVKRSPAMRFYPNLWNGISGFLDDPSTGSGQAGVIKKAKEELLEEIGLESGHILRIMPGPVFEVEDKAYLKTWFVHPVLVEVDTDEIHLNEEATDYKWILPEMISSFPLAPGFHRVVRCFHADGL